MADLGKYDALFAAAGEEWDIDPTVLKALVGHESGGDPKAKGKSGEVGLGQIMPGTQRHLGVTDPTDPEQSIYGAAKYLHEALTAEHENPTAALRYYNGGPDWRNKQTDAKYPSYVAGQYQRYAKADTKTATDATPAPVTGGSDAGPASAKGVSDDEFLKTTGAVPGAVPAKAPAENDAAFLERTGAKAGPAEPPTGDAAEPNPMLRTDPNDGPQVPGPSLPKSNAEIRNLLAPAPNTTYGSVLPFAKDNTTGDVRLAMPDLLRVPLQGAADLLAGPGGMVMGPHGPLLTPEATMALPMVPGATNALRLGGAVDAVPPRLAAREAPLSPEFKANPLSPDYAGPSPPAGGPTSPTGVPVAPPSAPVPHIESDPTWVAGAAKGVQEITAANREAGVPGSVGAMATPAELARLTPEQMKAYRRQAELGEILAPPKPGADTQIHVPGSTPTQAEYSGHPLISQKETLLRQRAPDQYIGEGRPLTENSKARVAAYEREMGSDPQIVDVREQQRAAAEADTATILRTARPVNLQPAVDYYDGILADPRLAERPDVIKAIQPLRDALFEKDGTLKTDPRAVWGMHDHLMTQMEKAKDPLNASSAEKFAFTQLQGAKKAIDGAMNAATGGNFQTFLDHQSGYFQQINRMELLQKFRAGMTDRDGNILGPKFHKFVTDLAIRRGRQGVDPAMDIPDSTMRTLIDIDNDLKRMGNIDLGKARGSPTNLYFELARATGLAGVHGLIGLAGMSSGGLGNVVAQTGLNALQQRAGMFRLNRAVRQSLAPPPEGFTPHPGNLLTP